MLPQSMQQASDSYCSPRVSLRSILPPLYICPKALLEFCLHAAILHTIDYQLEDQVCALDLHVQFEVQIGELLAFTCCQSSEQRLWYCGQICFELTDAYKVFVVSVWCVVVFACYEIVFHYKRLTWTEIAGVVERYGFVRGNWCAL